MKPIIGRLQKLERRFAPPAPAPSGPPVHEPIADGLGRVGWVRGENESLAESLARFLGITSPELRRRLQRQAAGLVAELATDIG
jgi:hypothetical protein